MAKHLDHPMEHNVSKRQRKGLFLGAGASYELGMPLVWELTTELKTWLTAQKLREFNIGWRQQGGGYSDAVIEDLVSMLEQHSVHYESILGYLETQFRRHGPMREEYHGLYSWLVQMVYYLLYARQINNSVYLGKHLPFYDGIAALVDNSPTLWVFSLNHDVMVEMIAARLSIPIYCGFSKETVSLPRRNKAGDKIGEIHAEVLTRHDLDHAAMYFPNPLQEGIYLLKIHGALDVFAFNDGKDLLRLLPSVPGPDGIVEVLKQANEELFYLLPGTPDGKAHAMNEIAYADDQGVMQFLHRTLLAGAYKFDQYATQVLPHSLLNHFKAQLNFVTHLTCIGYGFGDIHINTILRGWLEFSPERRIEIVGPYAEMPGFLLHLISQVVVTKKHATEYLDDCAGILRSPRETQEKHLGATMRRMGKERSAEGLVSFSQKSQRRISERFLSKIQSLPQKNGQPDFDNIHNPEELAQQWVKELNLSEEEYLVQLIEHFESLESSL